MKTASIRYCTGGCKETHHAHFYQIDPVDGDLGREMLCPGNLAEAKEWLDDETGEPTGTGFIEARDFSAAALRC